MRQNLAKGLRPRPAASPGVFAERRNRGSRGAFIFPEILRGSLRGTRRRGQRPLPAPETCDPYLEVDLARNASRAALCSAEFRSAI